MSRVFDIVLASNDMSLDRVQGAGLPVAMVFYQQELAADLRQTLDKLAPQYAGKALLVTLAQSDAPQAVSRFGVSQFPTLVTVKDDNTLTRQERVSAGDLKAHIAYLVGEGPKPSVRTAPQPGAGSKPPSSQSPVHISEADFEREVLQANRPVLVDFWAPWCGPCRMVEPVLNKLAREQDALKIAKVNVDENPGLASRYGAMSIPTMIVIAGGREVDRWVGAQPESALRSRVARWMEPKRQAA